MMTYKDYVATIHLDPDAKIFHGEVIGTKDVVTFQGKSVKELEVAFRDSVEDYLDFCKKEGKKPEKTFSGTLNLRMDPDKHRQVATLSAEESESINKWINDAIEEKIKKKTA